MTSLDDTTTLSAELRAFFKEQDPMDWINSLPETGIPNLFINNPHPPIDTSKPVVFVVIGPSGSGKDTAISEIIEEGLAVQGITATSRARRISEDEPEWKYTWMTESRLPNESDSEYEIRLAEQYDLIEHDFHHGSVYGLPKANLKAASSTGKPIIIRTENKGLNELTEKLADEYNLVSVFLITPDYETLAKRINDRNNSNVRMAKAPEEVRDAKTRVNYVLLNPDHPEGREAGEKEVAESMKMLLRSLA